MNRKVRPCRDALKRRPPKACDRWQDRPILPDVPTYIWEIECTRCERNAREARAEFRASLLQRQTQALQRPPPRPPLPQSAGNSQLTTMEPPLPAPSSSTYGDSDPRRYRLENPIFDPRSGQQSRAPSTYGGSDPSQYKLENPSFDPRSGWQMYAPNTYHGSDPSQYKF